MDTSSGTALQAPTVEIIPPCAVVAAQVTSDDGMAEL
jgi:hypothetical protein